MMRYVLTLCALILCVFAALVGCTRRVYVPTVSSHTIIDTLVREIRDSAMLDALLECDSLGQVQLKELEILKGEAAASQMSLTENRIKVETRWQTKYVDRLEYVRDTITLVEVQEVVTAEPYIPKFFWGTAIFAALVLGWGVVKLVLRLKANL